MTLNGRNCLFSGATGRIGQEAVYMLAQGGMNIFISSHSPEEAERTRSHCAGLPGKIFLHSNRESKDAMLQNIFEEHGSIDVLISKIGGPEPSLPPEEVTDELLDRKLHHQITNVYAAIRCALPYLKKSRAPRIILTSSIGAVNGFTGDSIPDSIAGGAVIAMTKCLASRLLADGITVNCIAMSGMLNDHEPARQQGVDSESLIQDIPMGRTGKSAEYGALIAYLASEESAFTTGHVFTLDGGLLL